MERLEGFEFWKQVDIVRGQKSLRNVADECHLNYQVVKDQRSDNRLPKLEDAVAIARVLGVSVESLLSSQPAIQSHHSPEVEEIARKLESLPMEELYMVGRMVSGLGNEGKNSEKLGS